MTSLFKIGLALAAVTLVLIFVHPAEADDDVKRKRVIIKVPHRVKHIYHHHTKKVHVHKKKPKPKPKKKKPHKHVHVVVEEEEIVQPIKSWKSVHHSHKGNEGWGDWKSSPSTFKHSIRHPKDFGGPSASSHYEEEFEFEDPPETHGSRHHGKGSSFRGGNSSLNKGKKKGRFSNHNFKHFDDHSYDASYEVAHHADHDVDAYDHEYDVPKRKPKTKPRKSKSPFLAHSASSGYKPKKGYSYGAYKRKPTKRPYFEETYLEPEEYDELYDRGPAYPERKEHPSWHERSKDLADTVSGSHESPSVWRIPKVRESNEFIDDTKDVPDTGMAYGNTGGFYPSNYNPITTITSSVVQNLPVDPNGPHSFEPAVPAATLPKINRHQYDSPMSAVPRPIKNPKKRKKSSGYLSQVSSDSDGQTVSYKSHVGHSSDSPSSSFQSVSYGTGNLQK